MQLPYLEALKDLPGYTPILKAVLKSQIQMLVEQLSEQTGEESVVITASVDDGTLCHLGSDRGRNFLDGREELKSQFLTHCISADDASQFPVVPDDTPGTPRPVKIGRYGTRSLTSTNMSRSQKSKNIVPDQKQSSQHTSKNPLPTTKRKSATVSSEFHDTSSSPITSVNTVSNVPDTDNSDIAFKYDLPNDNLTNNQVVSDSMIETVIDGDEGNLIRSQASLQTLAQEDKSVDNSSVQLLDSSQIKTEFIKSEEPDLEVTEVELGGDSNWNTGMVHNPSASELQIGTETESNQSGTDRPVLSGLFGTALADSDNTMKSNENQRSSTCILRGSINKHKPSNEKLQETSRNILERAAINENDGRFEKYPHNVSDQTPMLNKVRTNQNKSVIYGRYLQVGKTTIKHVPMRFDQASAQKDSSVNADGTTNTQYYVLVKLEENKNDKSLMEPSAVKTEENDWRNVQQKIQEGQKIPEGQEHLYKHSCSFCTKRFRRGTHLRRHTRLHTGVRFECMDCDCSYNCKSKLRAHCRKKGHLSQHVNV